MERFEPGRLAAAVHAVNRHAKTAPDNRYLYSLKKAALEKMISDGFAEKTGLHFIQNPRFSRQQSAVLITCGDYLFHLPPSKDDFRTLPHLGQQDLEIRNPKGQIGLRAAKQLLAEYTGFTETGQDMQSGPGTGSGKKQPAPGKPAGRNRTQSGHKSWFDPL